LATLFYLLDEAGGSRAYPTRLARGAQGRVRLCLEDREREEIHYRVEIEGGEGTPRTLPVELPPGERFEIALTVDAPGDAEGRCTDYRLFKQARPGVLYGALRLVVELSS